MRRVSEASLEDHKKWQDDSMLESCDSRWMSRAVLSTEPIHPWEVEVQLGNPQPHFLHVLDSRSIN